MSEFLFRTPAQQVDFPEDAKKQAALVAQWNASLTGFSNQGITGNPWTSTNASDQTYYVNPAQTAIPADAPATAIEWNAFPGRLDFYFPNMSDEDKLSLADTGKRLNGSTFPEIPSNVCGGESQPIAYGPYGPRGWQDEYCEWCITYDASNKITRIDLTCENPEYWNSLWMIDPNRVLDIYRQTLDKPQIQLADLFLCDNTGKPVIDPSTGNPLYNPLNKWNSGTRSSSTSGGAMHLTSTPNTLQTEIGLAAAATVQRTIGNTDPQALICCAQYGQPGRNSDPHIGQSTNQVVAMGNQITLTNPPGLYIQQPDFNAFTTPDRIARRFARQLHSARQVRSPR
jgi:hypothetical protein